MKKENLIFLNSISELHSFLNIKKPTHPLVSIVNLDDINHEAGEEMKTIIFDFYSVYLKNNFDGKVKYGQQYYDFDDGIMTFFAPKQMFSIEENSSAKVEGWMLVFHPDFLQSYPLAKRIKEYGYFSYSANEALHLSDQEENLVDGIMQNLQLETERMIDSFTQDLAISHIDLLLNYCNRFYNRQFITRKKVSTDLVTKFEGYLENYSQDEKPSVSYFAEKLAISPHYLNDMLKNITGETTQQHIQNKMIGKAKELLSTTNLSVSEIAYQLGFGYPQSFNKLFKNKTELTPLEFRETFN